MEKRKKQMADLLLSTTALRSPGKWKCLIQCGATWSAILLQVSQFAGSEASCLIDAAFSKANEFLFPLGAHSGRPVCTY